MSDVEKENSKVKITVGDEMVEQVNIFQYVGVNMDKRHNGERI